MKKYLIIVIILLSSINLFSQQAISLSFSNCKMLSNNHVGNEWSYWITITHNENTYTLLRNQTVELDVGIDDIVYLKATVKEDESVPDYGRQEITLDIDNLLENGSEVIIFKVIVRENRGRYSGNIATWELQVDASVKTSNSSN
jgi:hypothetical protein